ncbi:hypothetical protein GCM10027280_25590 [Micromonospora polyrhachis]|uniref:Uncharacterized protein n=1 Tax=Micromonospora polyrhachis TaxID=1282883 RepID=A0A7W7WR03_9ACTN|nr:hypothetical protein [Micromonospora polyrhachis]MBB4960349.1 hypothetical protein [Micromonospora polyrhachis]
MDEETFTTHAVLTAWIDERVPVGTLIALPGTYYTPSAGPLWLEVDHVGLITRAGKRTYVLVSGWDMTARARGQQVPREVFVRLDALHVPGVVVHPDRELEP